MKGVTESDFTQRRVLIADDEVSIREVLTKIISEKIGCSVRSAASGDAALEELAKEPFDVLITDMIMPGLHGLELLNTLQLRFPDVDVIVLTGYASAFPFVDVVNAGASDFISKPHESQEIEAKLMRVFEERDLRERLISAEQKYRSLFERSMEGNLLLEPETFIISDVNEAFCRLSCQPREKLIGSSLFDVIDSDHRERFESAFLIFRSGGQGALGDIHMDRPNADDICVDISVTFISVPRESLAFLTFRDVTERRAVENQLAVAAHTDPLTGLSNKRMLASRLEALIPRARREELPLAVMFIDLDNFKQCNDKHGHQTGDMLLASVGEVIRSAIRGGDEGFRYGGDEFAVLLPGASKDGAMAVAERMRKRFETTQQYGTTMSIGVAVFTEDMNPNRLLAAADEALYKAKQRGKNVTHVGA